MNPPLHIRTNIRDRMGKRKDLNHVHMSLQRTFSRLLFVTFTFATSTCVQAEIFQWKDDFGRVQYSDKQPGTAESVYQASSTSSIQSSVKLDVPLVKQGKNLCGPATIEMLFRYWGVDEYDQYDIAYNMLLQFADSDRVKRSGILLTEPIDWSLYPGSGTINMREFLRRFASVENPKLKSLPADRFLAKKERDYRFLQLKEYVARGVPVIVHQYWGEVGSMGHYRLMIGYDEEKQEVYLNDSTSGTVITQSYDRFFELWNVNESWLHYNAIVFNANSGRVHVSIQSR